MQNDNNFEQEKMKYDEMTEDEDFSTDSNGGDDGERARRVGVIRAMGWLFCDE